MNFLGGGGKGNDLLHFPLSLTNSKLFLSNLCQKKFLLDISENPSAVQALLAVSSHCVLLSSVIKNCNRLGI